MLSYETLIGKDRHSREFMKYGVPFLGAFLAIFIGGVSFSKAVSNPIEDFVVRLPAAVQDACGPATPVYLDMQGRAHKIRQMAAYALDDLTLRADWTDDSYIWRSLPEDQQAAVPTIGGCIIRMADAGIPTSLRFGSLAIDLYDGSYPFRMDSATGDYGINRDADSWSMWIKQKASFEFTQYPVLAGTKGRVGAAVTLLSAQDINFDVHWSDGTVSRKIFTGLPAGEMFIGSDLTWGEASIDRVEITSQGEPSAISAEDPRLATLMVQNLTIYSEQWREYPESLFIQALGLAQ